MLIEALFLLLSASDPAKQSAGAAITLHARDAVTHGKTIRFEPQPHKNTLGYWTDAADWASWDFKVKHSGRFVVEATQACGKGSGGSQYTVSVGTNVLFDTVPETGAFTNFVVRRIGVVTLTRGSQTLAVKPVTKPGLAVMDLRQIELRPAGR